MAHDLGTASEAGLKRPQAASDGLSRGNLSKNQYFGQKSWILALFCLQIEVYGLGTASEAGLKRPQMASGGLSSGNLSKNQDFGQKSWILALFCTQIEIYGLGGLKNR